jgi:hypothetical protein
MNPDRRRSVPFSAQSSHNSSLRTSRVRVIFYTNKLSFAVEFIYGDPPYYGQVVRDNARLNLRLVFEPVFVAVVRKREHLLSASITVATANEIKQLFLSYQAAGVSFHQALEKEPWGARTFVVSDPDGNLILFAGPAAD